MSLSEKEKKEIVEELQRQFDERAKLKKEIVEELQNKKATSFLLWAKHPMILLITGFLFTGVLGTSFNFLVQSRTVNSEQESIRNKELYRRRYSLIQTISDTTSSYLNNASSICETYYRVNIDRDLLNSKEKGNLEEQLHSQINALHLSTINWKTYLISNKNNLFLNFSSDKTLGFKVDSLIKFEHDIDTELRDLKPYCNYDSILVKAGNSIKAQDSFKIYSANINNVKENIGLARKINNQIVITAFAIMEEENNKTNLFLSNIWSDITFFILLIVLVLLVLFLTIGVLVQVYGK